jgi:hypothetical protein
MITLLNTRGSSKKFELPLSLRLFLLTRLARQMILVASPSKPFSYTAKMAPRRSAIIVDYKSEIEEIYEAAKETTQAASVLPETWTPEATLSFIQSVVGNVLKRTVADDSDIFEHGCDRYAFKRCSLSLYDLVLNPRLQFAGYVDKKLHFTRIAKHDKA